MGGGGRGGRRRQYRRAGAESSHLFPPPSPPSTLTSPHDVTILTVTNITPCICRHLGTAAAKILGLTNERDVYVVGTLYKDMQLKYATPCHDACWDGSP